MGQFTSVKVYCFDPDFVSIIWEITGASVGYTLSIYRSDSPEGEWELLSDALGNRDVYLDWSADIANKYRSIWYRLKLEDNDGTTYSDPTTLNNAPDAIAVDIARRMDLVLEYYAGTPGFVYICRSWGPRCPACWDSTLGKRMKSDCKVCYDTGFAGGFFDPIKTYMAKRGIESHEYGNIGGLFSMDPNDRVYWTSNYPLLKPRDFFIDNLGDRWYIKRVQVSEKMGSPLRQILLVSQIPKDDVLYSIEAPLLGEFEPKRDYHIWVDQAVAPLKEE